MAQFLSSGCVAVVAPDIPSSSMGRLTSFLCTGFMSSPTKECLEDIAFVLRSLGVSSGSLSLSSRAGDDKKDDSIIGKSSDKGKSVVTNVSKEVSGENQQEEGLFENWHIPSPLSPLSAGDEYERGQSYLPHNFDENMDIGILEPEIKIEGEAVFKLTWT